MNKRRPSSRVSGLAMDLVYVSSSWLGQPRSAILSPAFSLGACLPPSNHDLITTVALSSAKPKTARRSQSCKSSQDGRRHT